MAYNEYGWKILLAFLFTVPIAGFLGWAIVKNVRLHMPSAYVTAPHGFVQNDGTIFQAEILYAAAHRYAGDHDGHLPAAANWQAALRPYLDRAGATSALDPTKTVAGVGRFVMNRDLSGASLKFVTNPSRTLLFWQSITSETTLPSASYKRASADFGGVACDGTAYYLAPTGKTNDPLIWRLAERSHPPHESIEK